MQSSEKQSAPPVLGYAVQRFSRTNRRLIGLALTSAVLIAVWVVGWPRIQPYWDQALHLRKQYAISHRVLPADTVIFTEDPAKTTLLINNPGYQSMRAVWGDSYAPSMPDAWERKLATDTFEGRATPNVAAEKWQVNDTFGYLRTSAGNQQWIIRLDQVSPYATTRGQRKASFSQQAFKPVGLSPGSRGLCVTYMSRQILLQNSDVLTLFAPQPDPKDPAQIVVRYEINCKPGVIFGTVQDNGYVLFKVQSGPAKIVEWNQP